MRDRQRQTETDRERQTEGDRQTETDREIKEDRGMDLLDVSAIKLELTFLIFSKRVSNV